MTQQSLLAIPSVSDRGRLVAMSATFVLLFLLVFGGAHWLSAFNPWRVAVAFPFEADIPFIPAMTFVYLSLDVLLLLAPLILRRWDHLAPLFAALVADTMAAAVVFVALPVEPHFPPIPHLDGAVGAAFAFADRVNLDRNLLPSLHVAYAVTVVMSLVERSPRWARPLLWTWAMAIAASTLLLRQHYLLDVLTGALLGWAAWRIVGRWARRPALLGAFDVELLCLENQLLFIRRHRRYLVITMALWAASWPRWRAKRLLRTGFCALQAIDDLLDGDRPSAEEPLEVVDRLLLQTESRRFGTSPLERLVDAFVADLEQAGGAAALEQARTLIRLMQFDRRRRRDRLLLDAAELARHHHRTFALSLDLMLTAGGCDLRSADVPELADALGWCSTVRDLREDLEGGLVNLPADVAEAAAAELETSTPIAWLHSRAVATWLEAERQHTVSRLDTVDRLLADQRERSGAAVLSRFSVSVRRYAEAD